MLAVPEPLSEEVSRARSPARELPATGLCTPETTVAREIKTLQYKVLIHVVAVEEPWLGGELGAERQ
jgi:hypothetical protein